MLKFYFSPVGRVSRKGLWLGFVLPYFAISLVLLGTIAVTLPDGSNGDPQIVAGYLSEKLILLFPVLAAIFWAGIAVTFKRLHDRNLSGFWLFAPFTIMVGVHYLTKVLPFLLMQVEVGELSVPLFIAFFGAVAFAINLWLFVSLYFLPGTRSDNKYGPDPLEKTK